MKQQIMYSGAPKAEQVHAHRRSVTAGLEQRASAVISPALTNTGESPDPILSAIRREISLVHEQIQQSRSLDEILRRHLSQDECAINTELMQMEQRTPRYSPYRYPEREKLQRRKQSLRHEGRQLAVQHHHRLSQLHDRLLELLNRHDQLAGWPERDVG